MNVIIDTYIFLWWIQNNNNLSANAKKIIAESRNQIFLSTASVWEIIIKANLNRLKLPDNPEKFITKQISLNQFKPLNIDLNHVLYINRLPPHHCDPFDRILIAQSSVEKMPILTKDPLFEKYHVSTFW